VSLNGVLVQRPSKYLIRPAVALVGWMVKHCKTSTATEKHGKMQAIIYVNAGMVLRTGNPDILDKSLVLLHAQLLRSASISSDQIVDVWQ